MISRNIIRYFDRTFKEEQNDINFKLTKKSEAQMRISMLSYMSCLKNHLHKFPGARPGAPGRCQATQQPGAAVPEPGQVPGGGAVLQAGHRHLRQAAGRRRPQRGQDQEQPGLGLPQAGQVPRRRAALPGGTSNTGNT